MVWDYNLINVGLLPGYSPLDELTGAGTWIHPVQSRHVVAHAHIAKQTQKFESRRAAIKRQIGRWEELQVKEKRVIQGK